MSLIKLSASPIRLNPKHKGLLHKELGISEDKPIPLSTLKEKMRTTKDPALKRRLNFAINARKWHHK